MSSVALWLTLSLPLSWIFAIAGTLYSGWFVLHFLRSFSSVMTTGQRNMYRRFCTSIFFIIFTKLESYIVDGYFPIAGQSTLFSLLYYTTDISAAR